MLPLIPFAFAVATTSFTCQLESEKRPIFTGVVETSHGQLQEFTFHEEDGTRVGIAEVYEFRWAEGALLVRFQQPGDAPIEGLLAAHQWEDGIYHGSWNFELPLGGNVPIPVECSFSTP